MLSVRNVALAVVMSISICSTAYGTTRSTSVAKTDTSEEVAGSNSAENLVEKPSEILTATAPPQVSTPSSSASKELDLYKLLYESQKEANRELIAFIYWCFGLVASFLLFIAGTQIFFNFRLRKSDVEGIKKSNTSQIEQGIAKAIQDLSSLVRGVEDSSRAARDELSKFLSGRIDTVEGSLETVTKDVKAIPRLRRKLALIDIRLHDAEGHLWQLRGVKSNALSRFIKVAQLCLKAERPNALQNAIDDIEQVLKESKDIWSEDHENLKNLLDGLPEKYSAQQLRISTINDKLPIFAFDDNDDPDNFSWKYIKNAPPSAT